MNIRRTTEKDLPEIMAIVKEAQEYLHDQGIPQWQNGYPNEAQFRTDMEKQGSYVLVDEDMVVGFCYLTSDRDPDYTNIYNGAWLNDEPYVVAHRVAIKKSLKGKGYAHQIFAFAEKMAKEQGIYNLRVDTHDDNRSMQRCVTKEGFVPCGRVYIGGTAPRIGFQKVLK